MSEVSDQASPSLHRRIYEATIRGWLDYPTPVIRRGAIVPIGEYTLYAAQGTVVFHAQQAAGTTITADFTCVANTSELTGHPAATTTHGAVGAIVGVDSSITIDPAPAPTSNAGGLRALLGWLANRIRAITGATNWWDAPATTLATAHTHHGQVDNPHAVTAAQAGAATAITPVFTGTASTDQPAFGAEFLSGTGWTSAGWTGSWATGWINGASNVLALSQSTPAVVATRYQIGYTVTGRTAGSYTLAFGGHSLSSITATGAFGPTATTTGSLVITPTADFNGTIVLSIRAITAVSAPAILGRTSALATALEARFNTAGSTTFIGAGAGSRNTTGTNNSAVGVSALQNNTTGNNNSVVGGSALQNNTTGTWNSAVGVNALTNNTTGSNNAAVGVNALQNNTTGTNNSAVGVSALQNTTGDSNAAVGANALATNTTGTNNAAVGVSALRNNTTGGSNSAIGVDAGRFIADGATINSITNSSVFLGRDTRALASNQTNQIVIGHGAVGAGSNTATIGNTSITATVLRGNVTGDRFTSTVATGTAPLTVASTTLVANLNADLVRGQAPAVAATANTIMSRDAAGNTALADTLRLATARTPASAIAPGIVGEICWDENFVYVCTATNIWRRAGLVTW